MSCESCQTNKAVLIRSKSKQKLCKTCFSTAIESEVHYTIVENNLFENTKKVAVAISGGKDSTVLAHIINLLNKKYNYGIELYLLSVDEGITGYRDHSLATVVENKREYNLPLKIVSYEELFKTTMDDVVKKIGTKSNCTYCGVFRRQALEKGSRELQVDQIITGHNADDMAETILMNLLRGDINRLKRCALIKTQSYEMSFPRTKPFKYIFEKEIVMYAFYNNLTYFSTECTYSPGSYRANARLLIKELERVDPNLILSIIRAGERFVKVENVNAVEKCTECGEVTSGLVCLACVLLKRLKEEVIN